MPRIPFINNPLNSLPSSACSVSRHICSPGTWNYQMNLQWITGSERAKGSWTKHTTIFDELWAGANWQADLRRSDSPPYQPGQKVWLSTRDIRLRLPCRYPVACTLYVGPFVIQKQINLVTFHLKLHPQYRIHPTFLVSLLKPYHSPVSPSTEPGPITELPLLLILEDGAFYEVRTILDSRRRGGRLEYLVDWRGMDRRRGHGFPETTSWIQL